MNKNLFKFLIVVCILNSSCQTDIIKLLNSGDKDDLIEGAIAAGKTGDKKYVPLLLKNSANARRSTNFAFKGITVYEAKMRALESIYQKTSPSGIDVIPDSATIKFYTALYESEK